MTALSSAIGYIWTALLIAGLLASFAMVLITAWTGKFWWSRVKNGRRWPPLRSESPVKFWILWMFYGSPLLLIALLVIGGLIASVTSE
jgi:hypothetical protein